MRRILTIAAFCLSTVAAFGQTNVSGPVCRWLCHQAGVDNPQYEAIIIKDGMLLSWDTALCGRPSPTQAELDSASNQQAAAAWLAERAAAPRQEPTGVEAPVIVYVSTNGTPWSEGITDDGYTIRWRSGNSPWSAGTSATNEAVERAEAANNSLVRIAAALSVSLSDARWYATNRTAYAALSTADKARRDRIVDALAKWQLRQEWRDTR